ncbi:MAG TPA: hypothetical protein VGT61_14100 [Thermomicrobiales bacterium]|jgi:hypothetical protein|nr:hypothetical protein [Thermomicrobiales bacterium]
MMSAESAWLAERLAPGGVTPPVLVRPLWTILTAVMPMAEASGVMMEVIVTDVPGIDRLVRCGVFDRSLSALPVIVVNGVQCQSSRLD